MILLTAALAAMAPGCGEPAGDSITALDDAADSAPRAHLVDRDYPYSMGDDSLVCAEWEFADGTLQRESYRVDTMNRHLANAGTSDGVAHVDEAFRSELLAQGIERIETCDDARRYTRLVYTRLDSSLQPAAELDSPAAQAVEAQAQEPALPEDDDEFVEKIINGESFDHKSTVGLQFFHGRCTGILLGPKVILTAAHCVEDDLLSGNRTLVAAWIQPAGGSHQPITEGLVEVGAIMHPSWDGDTPAFDQALLLHEWKSPANSSTRWTRLAYNWGWPAVAGVTQAPVRIAGYGKKNDAGEGDGVGRRGKSVHRISHADYQVFTIPRPTQSDSAACKGDSGSSAYNTTLLNQSRNLALGVASKTLGFQPAGCALPQSLFPEDLRAVVGTYYSVPDGPWIRSVLAFLGVSCGLHEQDDVPYLKCW